MEVSEFMRIVEEIKEIDNADKQIAAVDALCLEWSRAFAEDTGGTTGKVSVKLLDIVKELLI